MIAKAFIQVAMLVCCVAQVSADQLRRPADEDELRYWLGNMTAHRYTLAEMSDVLGLSTNEIASTLRGLSNQPPRSANIVRVLPYPGGRHPRIGFLDGAIDPQRETKVSIFTPWNPGSYVVVDVPEAIFSNLGLIYLAHTHVPTIWSTNGAFLPRNEWQRKGGGVLESLRVLPNNIVFGVMVTPATNAVLMELWLRNGTDKMLTGLRVQNCVMLKAAAGFNQQTNANKVFADPYIACGSPDRDRWIITAWNHLHRTWANPPVPCLHSDPKFPDCAPGETQRLRGWLSFYEGTNVQAEIKRIDALAWRQR